MAGEATTIWPLDPHTKAKHVILRKYLNAWLPKLTRWNGRVAIVDGFAGPGVYSQGEEGSPIIALKAFLDHSYQTQMKAELKYLFIEEDKKRVESLRDAISKMALPKSVDVTILNERCETALVKVLDFLKENKSKLAPTFAFIDPFGVNVPMDMIKSLMAYEKCEVFITFMLGALHRFIATPEFERPTDALYGCQDWRSALGMKGTERETFLRTLYQQQLKTVVGAQYIRFFTMKDGKNKTIYDLFFATNHFAGIDAMKDAMWKVDQSGGGYSFSDATDPKQETMFTADPDWSQLLESLYNKFKGTLQPWSVVEEEIRNSPFRILKKPFKAEAAKENGRFKILYAPGVKALDESSMLQFAR
jgi:three-Cys-motif partner protein